MQTSIWKSNEKAARRLANEFLKLNDQEASRGRKFIVIEKQRNEKTGEEYLPGSFIIRYVRLEDEKMGVTIFRYIKKEIGSRIEWDEKFCTI